MKKILITGGSGLLGKYLLQTIPTDTQVFWTYNRNYPAENSSKSTPLQMDLKDKSQIHDVVSRVQPDIIIHCAAMGSVDYAENNYQEVRKVNVVGTEHLIKFATPYKSKIVYISSNAVYDGKSPLYNEDSPLNPINAYGILKQKAERSIFYSDLDYVIIRPFMLYGWPNEGGRTNWAKFIVESLMTGDTVKLVNDVYWMPTYARDCAELIWYLSFLDGPNQIVNAAAPDTMTLYEFGLKVAGVFGFDKELIEPVSSDYFIGSTKRPVDTTYNISRMQSIYGNFRDISEGLRSMKNEL